MIFPSAFVFFLRAVLAVLVCVHRQGSRSVTASVGIQLVQPLAAEYHVSSQHGSFIHHSYFCPCKILRKPLTNTKLAKGLYLSLIQRQVFSSLTGQMSGYTFRINSISLALMFIHWRSGSQTSECLSAKAVIVTKILF